MVPLFEVERADELDKTDAAFQARLADLLKNFAGRPTPLQFAERLTEKLGGPKIYLKREDLLHTGAHKINNAIGQGLLAVKMGKPRIVAEPGAGQHGVASAPVAAPLGLEGVGDGGPDASSRPGPAAGRTRVRAVRAHPQGGSTPSGVVEFGRRRLPAWRADHAGESEPVRRTRIVARRECREEQ